MKMLILGDSYSENAHADSWPGLLETRYTVENCSKAGTGILYSLNMLMEKMAYSHYDCVIFVISQPSRHYHPEIIMHGAGSKYYNGDPVDENLDRCIKDYYTLLSNTDNDDLMMLLLSKAMTSITLDYPGTKFILLTAFGLFHNSRFKIRNRLRGNFCVNMRPLIKYSMLDKTSHRKETKGKRVKGRHCHLTIKQNKTLFEIIQTAIEEYQFNKMTYLTLDGMEEL